MCVPKGEVHQHVQVLGIHFLYPSNHDDNPWSERERERWREGESQRKTENKRERKADRQ